MLFDCSFFRSLVLDRMSLSALSLRLCAFFYYGLLDVRTVVGYNTGYPNLQSPT